MRRGRPLRRREARTRGRETSGRTALVAAAKPRARMALGEAGGNESARPPSPIGSRRARARLPGKMCGPGTPTPRRIASRLVARETDAPGSGPRRRAATSIDADATTTRKPPTKAMDCIAWPSTPGSGPVATSTGATRPGGREPRRPRSSPTYRRPRSVPRCRGRSSRRGTPPPRSHRAARARRSAPVPPATRCGAGARRGLAHRRRHCRGTAPDSPRPATATASAKTSRRIASSGAARVSPARASVGILSQAQATRRLRPGADRTEPRLPSAATRSDSAGLRPDRRLARVERTARATCSWIFSSRRRARICSTSQTRTPASRPRAIAMASRQSERDPSDTRRRDTDRCDARRLRARREPRGAGSVPAPRSSSAPRRASELLPRQRSGDPPRRPCPDRRGRRASARTGARRRSFHGTCPGRSAATQSTRARPTGSRRRSDLEADDRSRSSSASRGSCTEPR